MNVQFKKMTAAITVLTVIAAVLASCQKIIVYPKYDIEAGSIYISQADTVDAVDYNVPPGKDTTMTVNFQAAIAGQPSAYDNKITFKVDTSKMAAYRSEYGAGTLLPATDYQLINTVVDMPAGAAQSATAELKLLHTNAVPLAASYVVPVVIDNVDGKANAARQGQVFYIVFTNNPEAKNFKIVSSTGDDGINLVNNLLASNPSIYWATPLSYGSFAPSNVVIDMGYDYPLTGISYYNSQGDYSSYGGGYVTQIQIELSTDGSNWTSAGIYNETAATGEVDLKFKATTARYMRLTVLQVQPIFGVYYLFYMGDLGVSV